MHHAAPSLALDSNTHRSHLFPQLLNPYFSKTAHPKYLISASKINPKYLISASKNNLKWLAHHQLVVERWIQFPVNSSADVTPGFVIEMSSHKVMYHALESDEIDEELATDLIVKSGTRQSLDKEYLVKMRRTRRGGRRKILILGFSILIVSLLGMHVMYSLLSSHPDHHVKTVLKQDEDSSDSSAIEHFVDQDSDQVSSEPGEDSTENGVNAEDWNSLKDSDFSHDQQMIEKNFNHSSISAPFDINSTTDVIVLIQIPNTTNQLENFFTSELSIENHRSSECDCRRRSEENSSTCECTKNVGSEPSSQKLNWLYSLSTIDGSKCQPDEDSNLDWTRIVASDSSSPCSIDNFFDALDSNKIKRRPFLATYLKDPVKMVTDLFTEKPVNKHSLIDLASEQVKDRGSKSCLSGNSDPLIRLSKCSLASIEVDQPKDTSSSEVRITSIKDLVDCHHELLQDFNPSKAGNLTKQEIKYLISHSSNNPFNVMTKFLADLNIVRSGSEINLDSNLTSDCETTRLTLDQVNSMLLRSAEDNLSKMSYFGLAERLSESRKLLEATFPGFKLKLSDPLDSSTASGIEQSNTIVQSLRDSNSSSTNIELKETKDSDTMAKLRELNQLDIQLYQYANELFQDRLSKSHNISQITHSRDSNFGH